MVNRKIHKLSAKAVEKATKSGLYGDGGGLYLQITAGGVKSWLFRYMRSGKARGMGLGPLHTVGLAAARTKAHECRIILLDGLDPLKIKEDRLRQQKLEEAKSITFRECATAYIDAHKAAWKSQKHAAQWSSTLTTYAYPKIGEVPVASVDVGLVLAVLEPIWTTKTETASRVRGRIETVLDWARVRGYRDGDNPARWRGHMDKLLPAQSKISKVEHFPALHYSKIAEFMPKLRKQELIAAYALEFLILTASRTNEVIGALWSEFSADRREWVIPPERMKAKQEHRIPMSSAAESLLRRLESKAQGPFVFPGLRKGKHLSNMAMLQLLERMGYDDLTVHGFRSTFRVWIAECTTYPREVAEIALAHTLKDKTEAAYQRGDLFAKRAQLMQEWANFCSVGNNAAGTS